MTLPLRALRFLTLSASFTKNHWSTKSTTLSPTTVDAFPFATYSKTRNKKKICSFDPSPQLLYSTQFRSNWTTSNNRLDNNNNNMTLLRRSARIRSQQQSSIGTTTTTELSQVKNKNNETNQNDDNDNTSIGSQTTKSGTKMTTTTRRKRQEPSKKRTKNENAKNDKVPIVKKTENKKRAPKEQETKEKSTKKAKITSSDIVTKKTTNTRKNDKNSGSNKNANNSKKETKANSPLVLLDIGKLLKGKILKRPSATVRSPYVADVQILNDDCSPLIVQAHAPALDVGGLCSPDSIVYLKERPPGGKTSHSVELVQAAGPFSKTIEEDNNDCDMDVVLVGAHPRLGEVLAEEVLRRGLLEDAIGFGPVQDCLEKEDDDTKNDGRDEIRLNKQITYGDSRVDFELAAETNTSSGGSASLSASLPPQDRRALIEVKNVVCSDYAEEFAPVKKNKNHCVIIAPETIKEGQGEQEEQEEQTAPSPYQRSAIFPWGRVGQKFEGKKVVSERAIKHLRNLSSIAEKDKNIQPIVLFVINRSDCEKMRACHEACPVFAAELASAKEKGCLVVSFRVRWSIDGKAYFDGIVPVTV